MKHISRVLLVTFLTFLLTGLNVYAADSDGLSFDFDTFDLNGSNKWYWQSPTINFDSDGDGRTDSFSLTAANGYPYRTKFGTLAYLSEANLENYNTALSEGTFKINGDTIIAHRWNRPFDDVEQVKVDVKFNLDSREDGEQNALIKLFGYSGEFGGSAEQTAYSYQGKHEDSGLVIVDGGLYSINPETNRASDYALSIDYVASETTEYDSLLSKQWYSNVLLEAGTLQNDTWYTFERIVDMRDNKAKISGTYVYQNQKIIVTNKDTGDVMVDSGWTRVGYNNHESRTLTDSLVAYTLGFTNSDVVELDNYSCSKMTSYSSFDYTVEDGAEDYLQTGVLHGLTPDSITFMASDRLCSVTSENVMLKKGNTALDSSYYTVEPTVDGMGFTLSFNKELEEMETYTLTITGLEYETYNLPGPNLNYTFETVLFAVENAGLFDGTDVPLNKETFNIGDTVKYKATVINGQNKEIDYMVVVALYSADNRLLDITGEWGKLGSEPLNVNTDTIRVTEDGCRAEVFIFDNMKNMKLKKY